MLDSSLRKRKRVPLESRKIMLMEARERSLIQTNLSSILAHLQIKERKKYKFLESHACSLIEAVFNRHAYRNDYLFFLSIGAP